jgi:hypothetical protein
MLSLRRDHWTYSLAEIKTSISLSVQGYHCERCPYIEILVNAVGWINREDLK